MAPSAAFLRHYHSSEAFREEWFEQQLAAMISIQIREIRLQRGWTQHVLATKSGLKQSYIARLESGRWKLGLTLETLSKIAAAFNCALRVEFVAHSDFIKWVFSITSDGVQLVKPLEEDLAFINGGS